MYYYYVYVLVGLRFIRTYILYNTQYALKYSSYNIIIH